LNGLSWAQGTTATVRGPVTVSWKRGGDNLDVSFAAPRGVRAEFVRNDSLRNLNVTVNGQRQP